MGCIEDKIVEFLLERLGKGDISRIEDLVLSIVIDPEERQAKLDVEGYGTRPIMKGYGYALDELIREIDGIIEEVMKKGECG
ncbi:MAG: hypothetical protein F7C32_02390 [Desulfurococcales archaeon]|nr:hypothetical protein [Desulfurococcales archaeon]